MRIEGKGLIKRFGRVEALKGVDLQVEAGQRVALIGPNGSGKSTMIRAVMGLLRCDEGELLLDGKRALKARAELAPRMAYVPQIAPQLRATVRDVVGATALVRGFDPVAVYEVAKELGLDVGPLRKRAFRDLSGGMKQKLLIALAFAAPVSLLILDEPTASLDPGSRLHFYTLYERVAAGTTVLLCSHRLEEIRHLVDHVAVLDNGWLAEQGPVERFLDVRARSLVEVQLRNGRQNDRHAERLAALGFRPAFSGWWVKDAARPEKMSLLATLHAELGEELLNLIVRDLETVDVPTGGSHDRSA
ncbi:MAG: ABC transporter ATP-binding protein [Deltaproteobacteria bacterium]|nr:ABC transporter ATP-binding protein [Deltaproteobacteria bacterium]